MKRVIIIIMVVCFAICSLPQESRAASPSSSSLEIVLWDCLLGAGIGGLVGVATLPFMTHPSNHYNRIAQGMSIGLICGLGFGVFELSPMYTSTTTPSGQKERIYGLTLNMPLK